MSWGHKASYRSYRAENARRRERNARKRERRAACIRAGLPVEAEHPSIWPYLLAGLLVFGLLMGVSHCYGAEVDQTARWNTAKVNPRSTIALDKLVDRWNRTASVYRGVEAMRSNGVPAVVAFCLFYREADNDMADSPAQGDPLTHRSVNEPTGRIPGKPTPFKWADAAEDAYYVCDHLDRCEWHKMAPALDKMESFNGFGYRSHGIAAPYLWSGTSLYTRGKYVRDGRYDSTAVDQQFGVCAILKRFQERGIPLPF